MPKKILIVEDNFIIQMFLEEILSGIGHEVLDSTDNGDDAIALIKEHSPDVILLDIGLSGGWNGIELAGIINEKHHIPFVFLTGNSDYATLENAKSEGPLHIINKPIDEDKLKAEFEIIVKKLDSLKII
ncbi:Response regulator receiver domain-containing protein [Pricia antarctica]|uniref:Response regulator receiver domain-containing protein n=1 Tax=Pricia antarctica TaxID=641691 RepID=A0A1G7EGV6_9FLAO|nr:response regulator [Pricia antarctica]SDE62882.1 Response regulator receiver domain-containing protein [Pricia antarctica]